MTTTRDLAKNILIKEMKHWSALTEKEQQLLIDLYERNLRDFTYRSYRKNDHYGYETAFARASKGDPKAILALISVFPEAEHKEPIWTHIQRLTRGEPGFHRKWLKVNRAPKINKNSKHGDLLYVLCFLRDHVEAHARGELTIQQLLDKLSNAGLESLPTHGAFTKWLHRTFSDIYSPES